MTADVRTVLWPLSGRVKGFTVVMEDFVTIVINEALSPDARLRAYKHEVGHIERGDFDAVLDGIATANDIEEAAHVV